MGQRAEAYIVDAIRTPTGWHITACEDVLVVMIHRRGFTMHDVISTHDVATKGLTNGLMPKAYT